MEKVYQLFPLWDASENDHVDRSPTAHISGQTSQWTVSWLDAIVELDGVSQMKMPKRIRR
mgnify:CR=1 FL=1